MTIRWALARGLTRLKTNYNAASEPILALNRQMGFVVRSARQYARKVLQTLRRSTSRNGATHQGPRPGLRLAVQWVEPIDYGIWEESFSVWTDQGHY